MKYLLDTRVVFGHWVVDDSIKKSVLKGDNQEFPVEDNNKDKKSTDLIFPPALFAFLWSWNATGTRIGHDNLVF